MLMMIRMFCDWLIWICSISLPALLVGKVEREHLWW